MLPPPASLLLPRLSGLAATEPYSLSPYVPENLVSRDGLSRPVPRQPAHLHTQTESGAYEIPPGFRGGVHL